MSQHEQFCQACGMPMSHQMHTVPVINIVRTAATATAISNPGKKRYQV